MQPGNRWFRKPGKIGYNRREPQTSPERLKDLVDKIKANREFHEADQEQNASTTWSFDADGRPVEE